MTIPYFISDFSVSLFSFDYPADVSIILHHRLHHGLVPDCDCLYADFFLFVKVKTEHITFILMIIIQIIHKLLFAALVVFISVPDL